MPLRRVAVIILNLALLAIMALGLPKNCGPHAVVLGIPIAALLAFSVSPLIAVLAALALGITLVAFARALCGIAPFVLRYRWAITGVLASALALDWILPHELWRCFYPPL